MIIKEAEAIPKGYGLAYRNYNQLSCICYPVPLNLIVRFFREVYFWLIQGCWKSKWEEELMEAQRKGFERGCNLTLKVQIPTEIKIKYITRGLEMMSGSFKKTDKEIGELWKEIIKD